MPAAFFEPVSRNLALNPRLNREYFAHLRPTRIANSAAKAQGTLGKCGIVSPIYRIQN